MAEASPSHLEILVVDDDASVREVLALCLERDEHTVSLAVNAEEAMARTREGLFDLAFVDLRLGADSGLDLIPRLFDATTGQLLKIGRAHV